MESDGPTVSAREEIVKPERVNHLGVEVFDNADVGNAANRIRAAGLQYSIENDTTCLVFSLTQVATGSYLCWYEIRGPEGAQQQAERVRAPRGCGRDRAGNGS